jgi:hypothetical protein
METYHKIEKICLEKGDNWPVSSGCIKYFIIAAIIPGLLNPHPTQQRQYNAANTDTRQCDGLLRR